MRILTFLLLMVVGTGQMWAQDEPEPEPVQFGIVMYNGTAENDGGTLKFYNSSKVAQDGTLITVTKGESDPLTSVDLDPIYRDPANNDFTIIGYRFFIMATPAVGHRLPAPAADGTVSFIRAEVVTQAQQAPSRRAVPTIQVGQTLPVKFYGYYFGEGGSSDPATEYYGLYYVVMPADVNLSVSITAMFPEVTTTTVNYIDPTKTGDAQNCSVTAYVLDGTEARLGYGSYNDRTQETWYVLPDDLTYTNGLELYGKVHLILADGKTMSYDGTETFINGYGTLDIYGQGGETEGAISATTTASVCMFFAGEFTINGGNVSVESTKEGSSDCVGIHVEGILTINNGTISGKSNYNGITGLQTQINGGIVSGIGTASVGINAGYTSTLTITGGHVSGEGGKFSLNCGGGIIIIGGQIEATGGTGENHAGMYSEVGDIILGWTNPTDYIKASSFRCGTEGKVVKTAEGKVLKYTDSNNNTVKLRATLTATEVEAIADKTLTPYGLGGYCGTTENDADGKNMTWEIPLVDHDNDDSTPMQLCTAITIEGEGSMADYSGATAAPWKTLTYNLILVDNETAYTTYASMLSNADKAMLAPNKITVTKNESGWGTYCFRYPVSYSLSDATAYMISGLNSNETAVTLSDALDAVAPDTPLLLNYSGDDDGTLTAIPTMATTVSDDAIVSQNGTDVITYGNPLSIALSTDVCSGIINPEGYKSYVLSKGQFIRIDKNDGLAAHRCVLNVGGNTNSAPVLTIGTETTSLSPVPSPSREGSSQGWYTLDGRKLNGKPTQKGLYIHNGRKVVIK